MTLVMYKLVFIYFIYIFYFIFLKEYKISVYISLPSSINLQENYMGEYDKMNKNTQSYNQGELPENGGILNIFRRLGRKLTFWYVDPFGERQNNFNRESSDMINELSERIDANDDVTKYIAEVLKNEVNALNQKINLTNDNLNRFIRLSDPELRKKISPTLKGEISPSAAAKFTGNISSVNDDDLEKWGEQYRKNILGELTASTTVHQFRAFSICELTLQPPVTARRRIVISRIDPVAFGLLLRSCGDLLDTHNCGSRHRTECDYVFLIVLEELPSILGRFLCAVPDVLNGVSDLLSPHCCGVLGAVFLQDNNFFVHDFLLSVFWSSKLPL